MNNIIIQIFILFTLVLTALSYQLQAILPVDKQFQPTHTPNLKQIKYNGKGFTEQMQDTLTQAITDSSIFYRFSNYSQAHYISKMMQKIKSGNWNIFIIKNINVNRITDVSTGFSFWSENDTWALWYQSTQYSSRTLHLVVYYSSDKIKAYSNVTTEISSTGTGVSPQKAQTISSIVKNLQTAQDIGKYLQKLDGQRWSVISVPVILQNQNPETYGKINADYNFVTYCRNVTLLGKKYSQIIYV